MIVRKVMALVVCFGIALIPALAEARAGGGGSMGSRGFRTYSAPAPTRIAPSASPIERSVTPTDDNAVGDQWTYIALDAESKLIPSFLVGKRGWKEAYRGAYASIYVKP